MATDNVASPTEVGDCPSDLELLASALRDAMDAHQHGALIGPAVDEVAWQRATRRARRRDAARTLRTAPGGAA